jgi:hypothetical protein
MSDLDHQEDPLHSKRFLSVSVISALAVVGIGALYADDNMRADCSSLDKWSDKEAYRSGQKVKFKGDFDDAYVEYKCTSSTKEGEQNPAKDRDHWDKIAVCCKC